MDSELIIFLLASVGATAIIASSKMFRPIREFFVRYDNIYDVITCYQCIGFWIGFVISLLHGSGLLPAFMLGCTTSLLAFVLKQFLNLIASLEEYFKNG